MYRLRVLGNGHISVIKGETDRIITVTNQGYAGAVFEIIDGEPIRIEGRDVFGTGVPPPLKSPFQNSC